eukprot:gnl/TRDRNA2_/TRDRNA2_193100_c0_seq1.p2 gnl/TRDRNA2_/TRDRNA2_193100_c0~~gnl/TRDRNA2_/TRDRNA2_193100_c0_seq1.p2  ORF type:complete len:144 (-),score=22.30 gnl/TRDRNA2_/TRDRNA2_193100_c0_seq1:36-467(-)
MTRRTYEKPLGYSGASPRPTPRSRHWTPQPPEFERGCEAACNSEADTKVRIALLKALEAAMLAESMTAMWVVARGAEECGHADIRQFAERQLCKQSVGGPLVCDLEEAETLSGQHKEPFRIEMEYDSDWTTAAPASSVGGQSM